MSLLRRLVVVVSVFVTITASCGGGEGDAVESTTNPAEVEPTNSVLPSPTVTVAPTGVRDLDTLLIPVCRTNPFTGGSVGFGTVPRAPEFGTTSPVDPANPGAEILVALAPVTQRVDHFTASVDNLWNIAESEQDFTTALSNEGRRLWLLCSAVAMAAPDLVDTHVLLSSFKALLAERHAWLTNRLEVLRNTSGSIREDDTSRTLNSNALMNLAKRLDEFAIEAGVEDRITPAPFTVPNPLLGISLDAPAGWLLIRNRTDIVLAAPANSQVEGVSGLGVPGWNFGTALRVRRLRHEAPWTLEDSAGLMDSLMARFGDRISDAPTRVDGLDAINRVYESAEDGWITVVAATVRDLQTYVFELGCPAQEREFCESALDGYVQSVEFGDL